jgi:hypothetical protein
MTMDQPKLKRPAGWKANEGSRFWVKSSAHGQRYMCKECGKESLGSRSNEEYMHKSTCSRYWTREREAESLPMRGPLTDRERAIIEKAQASQGVQVDDACIDECE